MIHKSLLTIFLSAFALTAFAQSGRIKSKETPTPTPPRPRVVYVPSGTNTETIKPVPTPTPKPKTDDDSDGEVIRVESNLVPIPASVTDRSGRVVTNLRLEDFQLEIEGKPVEISEITRSQSPVRLALLFDNSSS